MCSKIHCQLLLLNPKDSVFCICRTNRFSANNVLFFSLLIVFSFFKNRQLHWQYLIRNREIRRILRISVSIITPCHTMNVEKLYLSLRSVSFLFKHKREREREREKEREMFIARREGKFCPLSFASQKFALRILSGRLLLAALSGSLLFSSEEICCSLFACRLYSCLLDHTAVLLLFSSVYPLLLFSCPGFCPVCLCPVVQKQGRYANG